MNQTNPEVLEADLSIKLRDQFGITDYQLSAFEQAVFRGIENGETDVKELLARNRFGGDLCDWLREIHLNEEQMQTALDTHQRAFVAQAIGYLNLGWAVNQPINKTPAVEKIEKLNGPKFERARRLWTYFSKGAKPTQEALESAAEGLKELLARLRISGWVRWTNVERAITADSIKKARERGSWTHGSKHKDKEPAPDRAGQEQKKPKGASVEPTYPELAALCYLLDQMEQNPRYYLDGHYTLEEAFKIRISDGEMRENYINCLKGLIQFLVDIDAEDKNKKPRKPKRK
jgi:hypothetical protein